MFMPRALSNAIGSVARRAVGKDWDVYAALLERWAEIVGPEYAQATAPVKISFPHQPLEPKRRNGTLTVRLPRGLALEFSFKVDVMKQRINGYFGYDAIARIAFDPSYEIPAPPHQKPPPNLEALDNVRQSTRSLEAGDLKVALEKFGEAIVKSSSSHK